MRLKDGSLATLYKEGTEVDLVILAEYLPRDEGSRQKMRVIQGGKELVVDTIFYALIPLDEADICEI
jgi:hypothetical protein